MFTLLLYIGFVVCIVKRRSVRQERVNSADSCRCLCRFKYLLCKIVVYVYVGVVLYIGFIVCIVKRGSVRQERVNSARGDLSAPPLPMTVSWVFVVTLSSSF